MLPDARTVLITFPINVEGGSRRLVEGYMSTRKDEKLKSANFVQLGATSIWGVSFFHLLGHTFVHRNTTGI